jgi:hypothetical protein
MSTAYETLAVIAFALSIIAATTAGILFFQFRSFTNSVEASLDVVISRLDTLVAALPEPEKT